MTNLKGLAASLVFLAGLVGAAPTADAAEVYAIVANGQGILGTVPPNTPIRIRFPLCENARPTISFALIGSSTTVSFRPFKLYDPDGELVVFEPGASYFFPQPHTKAGGGRDGMTFKNWTAKKSGFHELVITTNATIALRASGKIVVSRPTRIPFQGDETSPAEVNPVLVAMMGDLATGIYERVTLSVRRVSGTPPYVVNAKTPSGGTVFVSQTKTARGTTTRLLNSLEFGKYAFTIGYQTSTKFPAAAGKWKGVATIKPFKGGYPATLALRNEPGVQLSTLDSDRSLLPPFGGTHVGVATDGTYVLVTSEGGGNLLGEIFDQDLGLPAGVSNIVTMATSADLPAGESIGGHRVMYMGGSYFLGVSSSAGTALTIAKFNQALQRGNVLPVLANSTDPTTDFFLAGDGPKLSVGVFHPATASHTVYTFDSSNLGNRTAIGVGGPGIVQSQGSSAAWRSTDSVFEMYSPDTLDYRGPSRLHRVLYSSAWSPSTGDTILAFPDPANTETMPTAVSVDQPTGITILHYVAADNPPVGPLGSGRIHRRMFDATGAEIPNTHAVLPRPGCNRPVSTLAGDRLFLAYETMTGVVVERYPLLRTK